MTPAESRNGTQKRGRPRLDIDPDAVADAVAELFAEGGVDAVSIVDAAEKLQVSRATLYRTVPTKEHLLGVLFERSTRELTEHAQAVVDTHKEAWQQLHELIGLLVDAAIRMRRYMPVFFGGGDLPEDVFSRWHKFSRDFESLWVGVVAAAMREGYLTDADPLVTARLLLGQCIWVSRWYRPSEPYDAATITDAVLKLLPPISGPPARSQDGAARPRKTSAPKPRKDSAPKPRKANR